MINLDSCWIMFFVIAICINNGYSQTRADSLSLLDFNRNRKAKPIDDTYADYRTTIANWATIEDVHTWIKNNFEYDYDRAQGLANNKKSKGGIGILSPDALWVVRSGMCVDLSRFAYETTKMVDSSADLKYLKIEFEPLEIDGNIFINHWLIAHFKDNEYYFFADSKRPDQMIGPYANVNDFIESYEVFRKRKIMSFKLLDSYKKVMMTRSKKKMKGL